ncbi:MAG: hypothetical protein ABI873_13260, partial [Marmoricola sp.]
MSGVALLAFLRLWTNALRTEALPPHPSTIFQDVWYEIALTQHLRHGVAISDPAVAGVPLNYHWFSNAHAAATQALSGATTAEVVMHLWPAAMMFTFVFAVAAAVERVLEASGGPHPTANVSRWWAGPLAALMVAALPVTLFLGKPTLPVIDNGFVVSSTSGVLALTIILSLVGPVLDLLHGRAVWGTWVVLAVLLALSMGSKPSILPVVACGSALVTVVQWAQTRNFPKASAALTLVSVLLIPLAALAVTGSTGGSRLQLFDTVSLDPAFGRATGTTLELPGHGGWLAPGLVGGSAHVWGVAFGLFLLYVLTELPRLLGVLGVADRTLRADPGMVWCSGVVASGFSGLWVLAHPAYSQHYFWRIVIGLGMALTVTTVVRLVPQETRWNEIRRDVIGFGLGGVVTGTAIALVVRSDVGTVSGRLLSYAVALVVFLLVLAALRLGPARLRARRRLPVLVVVSFFVVMTSAPYAVGAFAGTVGPAVVGVPAEAGESSRYLTGDEQKAALWLDGHAATEDVVATNVFCAPTAYRPGCRHVSFWVAALTGRQLYVGAWAYTEASLSAYAHERNNYQTGSPPWPGRVLLSLRSVRSPTARIVARLRHHGVSWIFADRRATRISPDLDQYATLAYANSDVRVYRLSG